MSDHKAADYTQGNSLLLVYAQMPQSKSASRLSETVGDISGAGGSSASFSGGTGVTQTTLSESSRNAIKGTRWEAMDNQIDENLGLVDLFYEHCTKVFLICVALVTYNTPPIYLLNG